MERNEPIMWGKCKVVIDDDLIIEKIQEGTTNLATEQGEKREATIEGGEVIATRYNRNKYTLEFVEYGKASMRNIDGIVGGHHKVKLISCDDPANEIEVLTIPAAVINVQSAFGSENGILTTYTCDATRQATGSSIVWSETKDEWVETTDEIEIQSAKTKTYDTLEALKAGVTSPNYGDVYKAGTKYYKWTIVNA